MKNHRGAQMVGLYIEKFIPPFQGLRILLAIDPGRRLQTRFALGCNIKGLQPFEYGQFALISYLHSLASVRISGWPAKICWRCFWCAGLVRHFWTLLVSIGRIECMARTFSWKRGKNLWAST